MQFLLDEDQRDVIEATGEALLVRAGPGTGKTELVARKVIHLHQSLGTPLERILVLSFSRSAVEEMRQQIELLLGKSHGKLCVKTFESIAIEILRESGPGARFRFMSEFAESFIISDCIAAVRGSLAPDVKVVCAKSGFLREVHEVIKSLKRSGITGAQFEKAVSRSRSSAWAEGVGKIFARLEQIQEQHGLFCLEDLLNRASELLGRDESVRAWCQSRFDYIIVDELQDTDPAQLELLHLLARDKSALCGLGDPHQAIFTFRGSDPANAGEKFSRLFNSRSLSLKTSYRCPQAVLAVAQTLAEKNGSESDYLFPRAHETTRDAKVAVVALKDSVEEAYFIARKMCQMVAESRVNGSAGQPLRWGDFAIIVRSIVRSGAVLEEALKYHDIPFRSFGDPLFYRSPAVAFLVNYFRWLLESAPEKLADLLSSLYAGVELLDAARLRQALLQPRGSRLAESLIYRTAAERAEALDKTGISAVSASAATRFIEIEWSHRKTLKEVMPLSRFAWIVVRDFLGAELLRAANDPATTAAASATSHFLRAIAAYEDAQALWNRGPTASTVEERIREFMMNLDRVLGEFSDEAERIPAEPVENAVQLLTAHHVKGLEFPVVFVAGMADDIFPAPRRKGTLIQEEEWRGIAGSLPQSGSSLLPARLGSWSIEQHLAEERRLALVAMTRARRKLFLTYPQTEPTGAPLNPSLFLDEIRENATQWIEENAESPSGPQLDLDSVYCRKDLEVAINTHLGLAAANEIVESKLLAVLSAQGIAPIWKKFPARKAPAKPVPEEPRAWAVTDLNSYVRCPRQYFYSHILNLSVPPPAPTTFGQAVHRVLAEFRRSHPSLKGAERDALWKFLIGLFEKEWRGAQEAENLSPDIRQRRKTYPLELSYETELDRRTAYEKAERMLKNYLDFEIKLADNGDKVVHIEKPFEFNFEGRTIKGRIDRIDLMGAGGHRIVDYKTGLDEKTKPPTLKQQFINIKGKEPYVPEDFQAPLYYLACMDEGVSLDPREFCFYALGREVKSELYLFARLAINPSLKSARDVLTGPELEMAKEQIVAVLERMETGEYPPEPRESSECQKCAFNFCCEGPNGAQEG